MTTPWPLVEPVALPLHLRLDRFVHLINFTLSLFFRCLFSKLCSQMYPGLPGKEGAPPPPASYPAPQVCERTFMLLRKLFTSFATCLPQNICFYREQKTSMISFVPQQPQAPVQVVTQVKAEALVGPKTIKAPRQKFFLNNCFP